MPSYSLNKSWEKASLDQGKQKLAKLTLIQTKAERLVPLDQLIEEADLPATDIVLTNTKGLEVVAERKGDADLNVWKFDKEKALAWLEERVARVAKVLQRQAIDLTQVDSVNQLYLMVGSEIIFREL